MIKLYDYDGSPYCQRVRIVLAEKKLPYEKIPTDIRKGEARTPEYLKLCPYGQVPVFVDGDAVLYESAIINEYLDEKYPTPALRPTDPARRAKMRILMDFFDHHLNIPYTAYRLEFQKPEGERDTGLLETKRREILDHLKVLDQELEGKEYLLGLRRYANTLRSRASIKEALGL
ncbi:MAG: glutathione S-transferase family protein [Candidatus Tectomicrobia bacterium]|uniref:Glutathione S-transferase family protein n=1 Tax=Tectimicrobiota bacterium TaxID=2528274 RepID=A0A932GP27_UNCTE|nr:glutathione S-transferase family protein [Candidatus Tectomicrobia bacterium]